MAEAIMLGGWGASSSIVAQERLIIQQRVQQRLREKQRAREFEAEQSDWLEQSVYRTATKASTDTTASVTSEVSRASTESATSYYFSSNSGRDHTHDNTSALRHLPCARHCHTRALYYSLTFELDFRH